MTFLPHLTWELTNMATLNYFLKSHFYDDNRTEIQIQHLSQTQHLNQNCTTFQVKFSMNVKILTSPSSPYWGSREVPDGRGQHATHFAVWRAGERLVLVQPGLFRIVSNNLPASHTARKWRKRRHSEGSSRENYFLLHFLNSQRAWLMTVASKCSCK